MSDISIPIAHISLKIGRNVGNVMFSSNMNKTELHNLEFDGITLCHLITNTVMFLHAMMLPCFWALKHFNLFGSFASTLRKHKNFRVQRRITSCCIYAKCPSKLTIRNQ